MKTKEELAKIYHIPEDKVEAYEPRIFSDVERKIEWRTDDMKPGKISGYAAVFNSKSQNLGGYVEIIAPGAFKKAIGRSDARALIEHDSRLIIGRQSAGTLKLKEDDTGLFMEVDPPNTTYARDLMVSIERGDIREQSFGFTIKSDKWEDLQENISLRTITEIDELFDVSPVTYPAYQDTSVALRAMENAKKAHMRFNAVHMNELINKVKVFKFFNK